MRLWILPVNESVPSILVVVATASSIIVTSYSPNYVRFARNDTCVVVLVKMRDSNGQTLPKYRALCIPPIVKASILIGLSSYTYALASAEPFASLSL